jgi:hypothetical protein
MTRIIRLNMDTSAWTCSFGILLTCESERCESTTLSVPSLYAEGQNCQGAFHTIKPRAAHCEQGVNFCTSIFTTEVKRTHSQQSLDSHAT